MKLYLQNSLVKLFSLNACKYSIITRRLAVEAYLKVNFLIIF